MPTPYTGNSVVDYLKSIGADSSFTNRKKLAQEKNINNYIGSTAQNIQLLGNLRTQTQPTGQGPSTGQLPNVNQFNALPQDGVSASGRFDGLTDDEIAQRSVLDSNISEATNKDTENNFVSRRADESAIDFANRLRNSNFAVAGEYVPGTEAPRTLSFAESVGVAQKSGLKGIADNAFAGLTDAQAQRKAAELKQFYQNQTSQNTTSIFNPQTVNGVKKTVDKFRLALDEINNDPFSSKGTKGEKAKSYFDSTAISIAQNFENRDDFMRNYQNNPELKKSLDAFIAAGGSLEQVTGKIAENEQRSQMDSRKNVVRDLMQQGVQDPEQILNYVNNDEQGNQIGDFSIEEVQSYMNTDMNTGDYLATLDSTSSPYALKAQESLIPEKRATQEQIAALANIPEQYKKLYFGTEEELGILAQKKANAEESKRILEEKENDEKISLQEKARYEVEKNNADMASALAGIEENRLAAKNYMTAKLAKLGALQTTGNAPLAIATLDEKYQRQKSVTEASYKNRSRQIEMSLSSALNNIENETDETILRIKEDLTKDSEAVGKEIMKVSLESQKDIMALKSKYAQELRKQVEKYSKDAKDASNKYAKDYMSLASKGFNVSSIESILSGNPQNAQIPTKGRATSSGVRSTAKGKSARDLKIDNDSTYKYFMTLPKSYRDLFVADTVGNKQNREVISNRDVYSFGDIQSSYNMYAKNKGMFNKPKAEKEVTKSTKSTTKESASEEITIEDL